MPQTIVTVADVREFVASENTREKLIEALRQYDNIGTTDLVLVACGVQLALLDILDRVVE